MASRVQQWEERFSVPVLVAALASVPAVFLTLLDPPYENIGHVANWISGAVLVAEPVALFAVSERKLRWLRDQAPLVGVCVVVVAGMVLAVGPVQLVRLVTTVGALRIVRVGRIIKSGRILRERTGLVGWWATTLTTMAAVLAAGFVAVVLADPTSASRQLLEEWGGWLGAPVVVLLAGAVLAAATFVVARRRHGREPEGPPDQAFVVDRPR